MVNRHIYRGTLAQPLRIGDDPASLLPALFADLGVATERMAVLALLQRHVIGHNARAYPVEVRGAPKTGLSGAQRLPALYKYLRVSNDRDAVLALAMRHVPAFSSSSATVATHGRPALLGAVRSEAVALEAELRDLIADMVLSERTPAGKPLTVAQCARRLAKANPTLYRGATPAQLVKLFSRGKDYTRREHDRIEQTVLKLRSLIGL